MISISVFLLLLPLPWRLYVHRRLFVCLSAGLYKLMDFHRIWSNVAHGPRVKPLDFGGNPDHVTSGLGPDMMRAALRLGGGTAIRCTGGYVLSWVCSIATICNISSLDRGMHSTTCHSSYFPCLAPCSALSYISSWVYIMQNIVLYIFYRIVSYRCHQTVFFVSTYDAQNSNESKTDYFNN